MIRIGITGQSGFIGTHLFNYLGLQKNSVIRISFQDDFFNDDEKLEAFVQECDAIVHLAAINRHNDPQTIYDTNISLAKKLITACDKTGSKPHILFSSSIQEERDNIFGKSKKEGRILLSRWAENCGATFTGMIIPNVFGPFGNPYYNSVVATFSHQLTHGNQPIVEVDAQLKLIYVGDLVKTIYYLIVNKVSDNEIRVPPTDEARVTEILALLQSFRDQYLENGILPDLTDHFERNLFNTFVCYIDHSRYYPFRLKLNFDDRGSFVETIKLKSGGQVSFSTTRPGITRGNHFHTYKAERFAVIRGRASIQIRRIGTNNVLKFELDGNQPSYVDMPIWHTHNITNLGTEDLYTIFWISDFYDSSDPDTYLEVV